MGRVETIGDCTLYHGDCLDVLKSIPEQSVNCCVTSPPYYGLRDYGVDGQIGLEPTPEEYVGRLVEVFREVRRVLRDDGTVWLNLGDSYATRAGKGNNVPQTKWKANSYPHDAAHRSMDLGIKPKNLIGIPWRVAFALQADGWYLRQDIIWHKPNPMPESVKDRCTKAHEYIFLLSKSERYFFDIEAMKEPSAQPERAGKLESSFSTGKPDTVLRQDVGRTVIRTDTRSRRSVWTVPTKPYKGAHFATFPPALIEPCILAGCPKGGTVLDPFGGSGTTGVVALQHGRKAVLVELNEEYIDLALARVGAASRNVALEQKRQSCKLPGFNPVATKPKQAAMF